jgi:hypothetical protein
MITGDTIDKACLSTHASPILLQRAHPDQSECACISLEIIGRSTFTGNTCAPTQSVFTAFCSDGKASPIP